jgi:hypothetical protein
MYERSNRQAYLSGVFLGGSTFPDVLKESSKWLNVGFAVEGGVCARTLARQFPFADKRLCAIVAAPRWNQK